LVAAKDVMTWNYRIVKREMDGELYYGIHEAYYNKRRKKPHSITERSMIGYFDSIDELEKELQCMLHAFEKKPLKYEDF